MKDPILAIFMRTDLNMSRGKMAVQAGHAVALTMHVQPERIDEWMANNQVKIVLAINSLDDLIRINEKAIQNGVPSAPVHDAGATEVEPNTFTCLALGIESRHRINKITAGWKTLK